MSRPPYNSRCQWCGCPTINPRRGRPRKFCSTACRVASHRAGYVRYTQEPETQLAIDVQIAVLYQEVRLCLLKGDPHAVLATRQLRRFGERLRDLAIDTDDDELATSLDSAGRSALRLVRDVKTDERFLSLKRDKKPRRSPSYILRRAAEATGESFTIDEIASRDGWMCWICGRPVDPAQEHHASRPNPIGPSIDHVVPVSLLGPHTRDNVRLAHLGCNIKRGARDVEG